jgi:hypothetical protein
VRRTMLLATGLVALGLFTPATAEEPATPPAAAEPVEVSPARERGLAWLVKNQNEDGSWGKSYPGTVTSLACLALLAARDEPYDGPHAKALVRGLAFLVDRQSEGIFAQEGHTWIHVQGFSTLALSEARGRALRARTKPDLDLAAMRTAVEKAARAIGEAQSTSGGWWYTRGSPGQHEGSTTVTAVQALVSARNFRIPIDEDVLRRGFEYLKRCQNPDGGFDYQLGPGEQSMKEGTAADVATLALMRKFDYPVMMGGYRVLVKLGPGAISAERFPYYGHFYGAMGMRLLRQEFPSFGKEIDAYVDGATRDVVSWQAEDGSWPVKGWMMANNETPAYATAFASLLLGVREGRLSVFDRKPPELPEAPVKRDD